MYKQNYGSGGVWLREQYLENPRSTKEHSHE